MTGRFNSEAARSVLEPWIVRDEGEETRAFCPLCEDPGASNSPSASFNFSINRWNCLKTDGHGGTIGALLRNLDRHGPSGTNGHSPQPTSHNPQPFPHTEDDVERWHNALISSKDLLVEIEEKRGWSVGVISDLMIGFDRGRYTIPIYDASGQLVNIRRYQPGAESSRKMFNVQGTSNEIFGYDTLAENDTILLCAGEPDRILALQEGFPAVTQTGGEGFFDRSWGPLFEGKTVYVCYDADDAGRNGTEKVVGILRPYAADIYRVTIPEVQSGWDITDVIMNDGPQALQELISSADLEVQPEGPPDPDRYFDRSSLQVALLAQDLIAAHPCALTEGSQVAVYQHGVYVRSSFAVRSAVAHHLGNRYRIGHENNVEAFLQGELTRLQARVSVRTSEPLLNVRNGMLDLPTGVLKSHDPSYLSSVQLPVEWDPDAPCKVYEEWISNQAKGQVEVLEEAISAMLDPSTTPSKALFLYGPARSGKSTLIRIMQEIAGPMNCSAVSLHELATDHFAVATVAGKILNTSADLSAAHVEDLSLFKKMTGEDAIYANPKFHEPFIFTNYALFAWSANQIPSVGENSRAYLERMIPIRFDQSFAGAEDPEWERSMLHELPGILARWVRAWQARQQRGYSLTADPAVLREFEQETDRVQQFLAECCEIFETDTVTWPYGAKLSDLHEAFKRWASHEGLTPLGARSFGARLRSTRGVVEGRFGDTHARGFNITLLLGT